MDFKVLSVIHGHLMDKEFLDFKVLSVIQGHLSKKELLDVNSLSIIEGLRRSHWTLTACQLLRVCEGRSVGILGFQCSVNYTGSPKGEGVLGF